MNLPENNEPPPPPYSETDLFSNPGSGDQSSGGRTPATSQATPSVAGESTVSRPPASITSSQSDVVFTPPLTPRIANSHDSFFPPSSSALAAQAYFESRPVPASLFPGPILNHTVVVTPSSRPDDFPYPQAWAGRDVVPADWQTFLNFLLPAHTATSNGEVFSRKLRAEEESIAAATPGSSTSGRSHASAQLEHLRNSQNDALTPTTEAKQEATSVAAEWNQGFFQARSLHVRLVYEVPAQLADGQRAQMPGAWDSGSDPNTPQHPHQGPYQPPPHPPPGMGHPLPWGPGHQHPPKSEFNFAGIRMNDDGLYIGSSVAADRNGLRLGGLVADTNGLRYRDNVVVGPGMFSGGPSNEYPGAMYHAKGYPPPVNPPAGYSPQPGTSPGAFPPTQNPFHDPSAARPALNRGPSEPYSYPQPPAPPRRSRSGSSGSSDSGSSSSTSSLGSLPDYDELDEAQIPVYRNTLQNWLIAPEKQVTKQDIIRLKAELREAKRRHVEYPQGSIDKKALKAEIKALRQEWRTLKRAQRSLRREARRQRRTQRRLEKKERRNSRHAQKQAERHHRHARGPGSWGSPSVPPPGMGMPPTGPPHPGPGPIGGHPPTVPPFGYAPGFGRGFGGGFGCGSRGGFGRGPGGGFGGGPGCGFGGGPGGGFGRGLGPMNPGMPMHPPMPGAWGPDEFPGDSKGQSQGVGTGQGTQWEEPWPREAVPAREPHEASQAKFKQLDELEKELARKMDQMFETKTENGKKEEKVDENEKQSAEVSTAEVTAEVRKLEVEVDALTRQVERLRMEADETFARELDEEDRRQAGMRV